MTSDATLLPDPEFRAHLEWEVVRTLRREQRLGTHRDRNRRRRFRIAAIVAACLALGTASNLAVAQVRDGARRDSLSEVAKADLAIAELRERLARTRFDELSRKVKAGVGTDRELSQAEAEMRAAESRIARIRLDLAETGISAQAPRDELTAPRVGGRDFVTERLDLELSNAQREVAVAEQSLAETERRLEAGVVPELARAEDLARVARAQEEFGVIASRRALRREFLDKGTPAEQLAIRQEAAVIQFRIRAAQQMLGAANTKLQWIEKQRAAGVVTELDLLHAQVDVKERQLELARLSAELRRISDARRDRVL